MPSQISVPVQRERNKLGPRFALLWTATTSVSLADGVLLVTLPLVTLQVTRSPLLVALTSVALTLPWFFFAIFAGVLADRHNRRMLMILASCSRVLILVALAGATVLGALWLPMLYLACVLIGMAETATDTASQTLIPMVVDRNQLRRANGYMHGTRVVLNDFIGMPVGGLLVGVAVAFALLTPAALYAVAALVLLALAGDFRAPRQRATAASSDLRVGLMLLWKDPMLRSLSLIGAGINVVMTGFLAVFVVFAVGPASNLGLSEASYGLLLGVTALGPLVGSLLTDRLGRALRPAALLTIALVGIGIGTGVPAVAANTIPVGLGMILSGGCAAIATVLMMSLRQELVPSGILGRATATFWLVSRGAMPFGALVSGLLAELAGVRPVFMILAALALALVVLSSRLRPATVASLDCEPPGSLRR